MKKKVSKTEAFKKTIEVRNQATGKESRALTLHNRLIESKKNINGNLFLFIATMLEVETEETWKDMSAASFESYVCLPEVDVGLEPETVKKYTRILKRCFAGGLETEEIAGMPINKLALIISTKKPMYWLGEAKINGIVDLKNRIAVEDRGEAEPEPKVKRIHNMTCPHCGKVIEL